jgi:hypothetical protein
MKKIIVIGAIILFLGTAVIPSMTSQNSGAQSLNTCMRIDFFESNPTEENLSKAALIDFPSTIYIASRSLDEFNKSKEVLFGINPNLEAGYWHVMDKSIFVSAFCFTYEIENLITELQNRQNKTTLKVLLDLEFPWNKTQILTNLLSFHKNKKLLRQLFEKSDELNIEVYTAEYPAPSKLAQKFFELSGVSFSVVKYPHKTMVTYYSKMLGLRLPNFIRPFINNSVKRQIVYNSKRYGQNFQVAVGITATGGGGSREEKYIISPEILDRDLSFLAESGVKVAVVFKLGGLNESYLNVIKKYHG